MSIELVFSIFLGIGLAAAAGFRVFLPLLALSLVSKFGGIEIGSSFEWIGSYPAIIALSIASVLEIGAYYIPLIDNLLDTIAVPMAAVAGTGLVAATLGDLNPMFTWGMAIIAGGGTATAVSSASAGTRALSTASTAGFGNPFVSTAETGASFSMILFSFLFPPLALILVIGVFYLLYRAYNKLKPKR